MLPQRLMRVTDIFVGTWLVCLPTLYSHFLFVNVLSEKGGRSLTTKVVQLAHSLNLDPLYDAPPQAPREPYHLLCCLFKRFGAPGVPPAPHSSHKSPSSQALEWMGSRAGTSGDFMGLFSARCIVGLQFPPPGPGESHAAPRFLLFEFPCPQS